MFKQRLIYKLLLIFMVFALLLITPISLTIYKETNKMIEEEEVTVPPTDAERAIHTKFIEQLTESLLVFSFYIFIFALILSLFFLRNLLRPLKDLYNGAQSLKDGNFSTRLNVTSEDELGEVAKSFNEMAAALEKKTEELKRKEVYISAMMDPLWVVDKDNNVTDINPAFTKLFGYGAEEAIGASIYDFLDEENTLIMKHQLDEREKGITSTYEISITAKDGSQIPVLITGAPIIRDDKTVGKIGIFKDFRKEHELRNKIKESRDYLETIMDSIEDDIIVVDRDFRIVAANRAVKTKVGENIVGEFCYYITHNRPAPCWPEGHDCPVSTVFETGRTFKAVHEHTISGGKKLYHEIVACPMMDSKGNVVQVLELLRDITDRKKYEEKITQRNIELTTINSIAGILSRSLKSEDIFNSVLDKLTGMLQMDGGGIYILDDTSRELTCTYHKGISEEFIKTAGRLRIGEDIPGKVAATNQISTTSDLATDRRVERSILKHSGIKGYCCIPIKGKERVLGVLCLFSFKTHFFTPEEEKLLLSVGEMTGIALENIRLYEKMRQLYELQRQRRMEDHKNLFSISSRLASALDIKAVMNSTLNLIRGFFKADLVWLLERREDNLVLNADSGLNIKEKEIIYQKGMSSIEWYAVEKKEPIIVPVISAESRFYLSAHIGDNYRSAVCIPVYVGEKALGALALYYTMQKELKEEDIHFLKIVSSMLAVSLERAEIYEKTLLERELSDTILQSISDGIMTVDTNGRVIAMNKAAYDMIGIRGEAVAGGSPCCEIFTYSDENFDFRWSLGTCLDSALNRMSANVETQLTTTSGKKLSILISSSPVINPQGEIVGVVNVLRNITREKEIDRMKTELVRMVSHQFRTPLSAIVGMTEMVINEDIRGEKAKEYLETVLHEGVRLSDMVSDLLNIARIESGKEIFKKEPIDFAFLIEDVKKLFSNPIEKKRGNFSTAIKGDVDGFLGNREKLFQLVKNLIDNSIIYSDEGCSIKLNISKKNGSLEIKVSDNGWGIPEEDMPHLGERFYRGKHGHETKGTGLGLALCKEIVAKHNGSIIFDSNPGKGTTVTVTLPFRRIQ